MSDPKRKMTRCNVFIQKGLTHKSHSKALIIPFFLILCVKIILFIRYFGKKYLLFPSFRGSIHLEQIF